jgi:Cu+-exporting ATPase
VSVAAPSLPSPDGSGPASYRLELEGLTCASCARRVREALVALPGVVHATVDPLSARARVETEGARPPLRDLLRAVEEAGYGVRVVDHDLPWPGELAPDERDRLLAFCSRLPGVVDAEVVPSGRLRLRALAGGPTSGELRSALARFRPGTEPSARFTDERTAAPRPTARSARESHAGSLAPLMAATALAGATLALSMFARPLFAFLAPSALSVRGPLEGVLATLAVFGPGWSIVRSGLGAWRRFAPDMDALVSVGILAAWGYGVAVLVDPGLFPPAARHLYFDSAALLVAVLLLGRALEGRIRRRADDALEALAHLVAPEALLVRDGKEIRVAVDDLLVGDVLRVAPGERVPVDGVVRAGEAAVDESLLSGEPLPRRRGAGGAVHAGTLVLDAPLTIEATAVGSTTRLAGIVRTVESARASRLRVQRIAEGVVRIFAPALLGAAVLAAVGWLIVGGASALPEALTSFVCVLVVACPCAVGLAAPAAVAVASSRAAALGVLVRRAETFEVLARADTVAFDKTGTLTLGRPVLVSVTAEPPWTEDEVLAHAAALERHARVHPLARAVLDEAHRRGLVPPEAEGIVVIPGRGVAGRIAGRSFVLEPDDGVGLDDDSATRVRLLGAGRTVGVLVFRDRLRPESAAVVDALRRYGLEPVLLSGDGEAATRAVAESLGVSAWIARCTPEDKAAWVRARRARGHRVVFVGDGLNDAPALATADLGVAPEDASDVAGSSADVLLLRHGLGALPQAFALARRTVSVVRANLFWAFVYNLALVPLAAGAGVPWGLAVTPVEAAVAMTLSSLFVLGNSLRLLRTGTRPTRGGAPRYEPVG